VADPLRPILQKRVVDFAGGGKPDPSELSGQVQGGIRWPPIEVDDFVPGPIESPHNFLSGSSTATRDNHPHRSLPSPVSQTVTRSPAVVPIE